MNPRLEHANFAVRDLDVMVRFIQTALPEFRVRSRGQTPAGEKWVHVGTDSAYLALYEAHDATAVRRQPYDGSPGVNHIGFEVEDAEEVRRRLVANGYKDSTVANNHPYRRRVYFFDPEGNDWEFVQYFSSEIEKRNDYTLGDA